MELYGSELAVSYQQANPTTGGGSYLIRFEQGDQDHTPCILLDSGVDVDLDDLLADDDYLAAILLTHAHYDHYATLPDSLRDGAPVYTSAPTADLLENVLTEGEKNYDINSTEAVIDALEPIDGWTTVVPDVDVSPVPAGHTPGAAGFLVRYHDINQPKHILCTGDFTTRPVAGFPGFTADLPVDVDVLFTNISTTDNYETTLNDSLSTILERTRAGSPVLATASALTGLHYAYLLGHLGEQLDNPIPVTVVGQTAKLYNDLNYNVPNVTALPVFESPTGIIDRGTVTLAGPEVPQEGGAKRLFNTIRDDPSATLVQLTGGAQTPVRTGDCTIYDYEIVNHPTIAVIDELVKELDPIHVIAGHGKDQAISQFRGRYDERFVYANNDNDEQILYDDGSWSPPPWLSNNAVRSILNNNWEQKPAGTGDVDLPPIERMQEPDLEAEGIHLERFEEQFGAGNTTDGKYTTASEESAAEEPSSVSTEPGGPTESGTPVPARVLDAGDGVTLLHVLDGEDVELEHGTELEIMVPDESTTMISTSNGEEYAE